jgi:hypothetical protein
MSAPTLVSPPDRARFRLDEFIRFEWRLADAGSSPVGRLQFCISQNPASPFQGPKVYVKRWIIDPLQPESSWIVSPAEIGLQSGQIYYWRVAQDPGFRQSPVRSLQIGSRLALVFDYPVLSRRNEPFPFRAGVFNDGPEPVRLTFPTGRHFEVRIFHNGRGGQQLAFENPPGLAPAPHAIDVPPQGTYWESFAWDGAGFPGSYEIHVRCQAREFGQEQVRTFARS